MIYLLISLAVLFIGLFKFGHGFFEYLDILQTAILFAIYMLLHDKLKSNK